MPAQKPLKKKKKIHDTYTYFCFNHNLFNGYKQNNKAKIKIVTKTKVLEIYPFHSKDLDLRKIQIFTKAIKFIKFINGHIHIGSKKI